jgi:hypothetical protein
MLGENDKRSRFNLDQRRPSEPFAFLSPSSSGDCQETHSSCPTFIVTSGGTRDVKRPHMPIPRSSECACLERLVFSASALRHSVQCPSGSGCHSFCISSPNDMRAPRFRLSFFPGAVMRSSHDLGSIGPSTHEPNNRDRDARQKLTRSSESGAHFARGMAAHSARFSLATRRAARATASITSPEQSQSRRTRQTACSRRSSIGAMFMDGSPCFRAATLPTECGICKPG